MPIHLVKSTKKLLEGTEGPRIHIIYSHVPLGLLLMIGKQKTGLANLVRVQTHFLK